MSRVAEAHVRAVSRAELTEILERDVLPVVDKPSRYLGNEHNAVRKEPDSVDVRMALAFPDLYDLGLGNLGIHILYAAVNALPWASCERLYAPGVDLERELRAHGLPLFTLETRSPVRELDLLGFTLQSELTYTNILNLLDPPMSLRTADRQRRRPADLRGRAGGTNPEPLAPFVDFFVIGDGDAILEIAALLRRMRGATRADKLAALAESQGAYVPALYPMETPLDGRCCRPSTGQIASASAVRRRDLPRRLHRAVHPAGPRPREPRGPARVHAGVPVLPGGDDHAPRAERSSTTCRTCSGAPSTPRATRRSRSSRCRPATTRKPSRTRSRPCARGG
ncbi:MAG: hypothetical protein R3F59_16815 [Myxococcota bacterium]